MTDTIIPHSVPSDDRAGSGARLAALVVKRLGRRIRHGSIVVVDESGEQVLGSGSPTVRVTVHDQRAFGALIRSGSVGLGASYVNGWWDCDDVTLLVQLLERNLAGVGRWLDRSGTRLAPLSAPFRRVVVTDKNRDRANIRAHYDLGNEFFEQMLDETMSYSCAFFEDPAMSLAEASEAKLERICRKLSLGPGDHVVEIGSGWGSFAVHAATRFGCRITTTTISDAQYEYTAKRVADAGLGDRVTVCNQDYRDLDGTYDKLVSIEMIEAVGWRQLDTFFSTCARTAPTEWAHGTAGHRDRGRQLRTGQGARRPGETPRLPRWLPPFDRGHLPLESRRPPTCASSTSRTSVATTPRPFGAGGPMSRPMPRRSHGLGLGEAFYRLWHIYLCYCEAAFLERHVSDVQVVLARSGWRGRWRPGNFASRAATDDSARLRRLIPDVLGGESPIVANRS